MGKEYGIIGYPLSHSFSPEYFGQKFLREGIDATYTAFALKEIDELPALLRTHPQLKGFNVTIPHKTSIIPFLQRRNEEVVKIGACNCVAVTTDGLIGYNTDWAAFRDSLKPLLKPQHKQALVLGNGGAAKAVVFALQQLGIAFTVASRAAGQGALAYSSITPKVLEDYKLIINTTPLGMMPDKGLAPEVPYEALGPDFLLYDLIYNPAETFFLQKGKAAGAVVKNGQEMLELQAEASWGVWKTGS